MGKVILIGTEHGDLKGSERLEHLLETIHPDIVSVEFSLDSLRLSRSNPVDIAQIISRAKERGISGDYLQFLSDLVAKYGSEFEYTTARAYTDKHKTYLFLSDDPTLAETSRNVKLSELRKIIENLPINVGLPIPSEEDLIRESDETYEFANRAISGELSQREVDKFLDSYRGVLIGQRDNYMAQRIRQIFLVSPNSVLAHISGFAHLLNDSKRETLYSKIIDLIPERRLIHC